jgi:hypothetical protein
MLGTFLIKNILTNEELLGNEAVLVQQKWGI